ncbi:MAG: response regulator [Oscillospiraceae bacterium]|nr:response regulator [Oscillospiraceae bacterium]
MTVFAVDDMKLPLEALTAAIRKASPESEILSFRSSREALEAAREIPCDVAFIDIRMPEISGMQLAQKLKLLQPKINIIFATGYSDYTGEAIQMHCSGYILKPVTAEKVRQELEDLRYPVKDEKAPRVHFRTFGSFEVFLNGSPAVFRLEKTRELLACMVDRGSPISNGEAAAMLWEREVDSSYIRQLRKDLLDCFRAAGCEDVLILRRNHQGIRTDLVSCDYYDWLKGQPRALNAYRGEYMVQYSWAEFTHAQLDRSHGPVSKPDGEHGK